ncbi:MAG: nuclear transport factor 2 family protein [Pseudomonadota bacterium]
MTYSNRWDSFPDYILGITKEIWEDRGLATLHQYYAPEIPVRSPGSLVIGNQNVISATMATLAEFPDRQLLGEDVIWCETESDNGPGHLSSHRIISTATHTGDGMYGKATGRALRYRIIADCHAVGPTIDDEWLIRDQGAIVRQMGWDPKEFARDLIAREGGPDACVTPFSPGIDRPGPYRGTGNDNPWGIRYADLLTGMMNRDFARIEAEYDRACHLEYPGGVTDNGWAAVDRFWMTLRSAFPDATFRIEHRIGREDPLYAPRAAIRWSLHGTHSGWGAFGAPTGAEVYVMGAAHAEFGPWGLRREYVLFDETAIWKQILLSSGEV